MCPQLTECVLWSSAGMGRHWKVKEVLMQQSLFMHAFTALKYSHLLPGNTASAGKQQTRSSTNGKNGWRPANVQGLSDLVPGKQCTLCSGSFIQYLPFDSLLSAATLVDLLCPCIQLVKELLCDVGCIPRDSNHGTNPYKHKTLFTLGTLNT